MKKVKNITALWVLCLLMSIPALAGDTPISGRSDSQTYLDFLASGFADFAAYLAYLAGL